MDAIALDQRLSAAVAERVGRTGQLLIDGKFVPAASGKTFDVFNPATGTIISHVAEGDAEDINRAVTAARRAFENKDWARMTPSMRGRLLWKLGDLIEKHTEEFAQLESIDNGKPVSVARVADVPLAADTFHYMAGWATKITGRTTDISFPGEWLTYSRKEPVGVVGQIIPWNFPLLMAAWKLAPALAAGNTIILKTAEQTPLSALLLAELVMEAGFPAGVVNVISGFGETAGAALAAHDDVDKVAFTGSTEVGKLIVKAAAGNLKKVTLELGGKSPVLVFPDADIDAAVAGAANAIFFNMGQCCVAGSRLMAHKKVYEQIVEGVSNIAGKLKVGDGMDPTTEVGPLVSQEQLERVTGFLGSGRDEGARVAAGGGRVGNQGYFVAPTVLADTSHQMRVVREEIFGPVVCAAPFDDADMERLVGEANNTPYGLAASVWTRDHSLAHRVANRLRAGTVWINCHNVFDAAQPFGGYKQSGWGRENSEEIFHSYTETKAIYAAL